MGASAGGAGAAAARVPVYPIAYGGGSSIWTALPSPARDGYLLEEWTLDGELRKVILRSAAWARSDVSDQALIPGGFPFVRGLSLDPDGVLWVTMLVKDPRAGSLVGVRMTDSTESQFLDLRYEAIDPRSGSVLASGHMSELPVEGHPAAPPFPFFIPRSRLTHQAVLDTTTGLERIRFFEMRLVRRE
jgi:hypothetical protein